LGARARVEDEGERAEDGGAEKLVVHVMSFSVKVASEKRQRRRSRRESSVTPLRVKVYERLKKSVKRKLRGRRPCRGRDER
jgi:hypothetical protein